MHGTGNPFAQRSDLSCSPFLIVNDLFDEEASSISLVAVRDADTKIHKSSAALKLKNCANITTYFQYLSRIIRSCCSEA